MVQFLAPPLKSGGVYDFSCKLQASIGQEAVPLVHLSKENAADWNVSSEDSVVLQFSGYGFDKRGAPLWLLREIEKRRKHIKTLGVFFHELYAFGPPWSSSFWLSPVQRHIARRLAEMSDFWMTSREGSAEWLRRFAGGKPHAVLPVFSTIGEPDSLSKIRTPKIIVFGSEGLRQATYRAAGDRLFAWAERDSLEIHDIGTPLTDTGLTATLPAKNVIQHGRLNDLEVGGLMRDALFGLLAYPVNVIAKSSVFAAYSAHGLCTLLISDDYMDTDGLVPGVHYLQGFNTIKDVKRASAEIGQNAWSWYQSHSQSVHARTLVELIADADRRRGRLL